MDGADNVAAVLVPSSPGKTTSCCAPRSVGKAGIVEWVVTPAARSMESSDSWRCRRCRRRGGVAAGDDGCVGG